MKINPVIILLIWQILIIILINEFAIFENGSTMFDINYCKESNTPYIVFNDIECVLRKSEINSYLVLCETEKNEKMLKNYVKIINEIKDQVLFIVDDDFLLVKIL